ncbi:hypothetical protein TWF506_008350 [Arthrobotrys conoides]|uniref:Uncharacterized protein n=1 Tax=Arthrobotrys conoides TaxID=74498 RepID=A0AAN8RMN6_9PEZI
MWSKCIHLATAAPMLLAFIARLTNTQLVIPEVADSTEIATQALVFYFSDGTTYGYTDYAHGWNGNCNKLYSPAPGKATVDYVEYLPQSSAIPGVFSKNVIDPDIGRTEDLQLKKVILYRDPYCTEEVAEKVQREENEDGKDISETVEVLEPIELDVQEKVQKSEQEGHGEEDAVHHDSAHVFLNDQGLNVDAPASFRLILGRKGTVPTLIDQAPTEEAPNDGPSVDQNLTNDQIEEQSDSPEIAKEEAPVAPTESLTEEEIKTDSTPSDGIIIEEQAAEESDTSIDLLDKDQGLEETAFDRSSSDRHPNEESSISNVNNEESPNDNEDKENHEQSISEEHTSEEDGAGILVKEEDASSLSIQKKVDEKITEEKPHDEKEKINTTDEYFTELEIEGDDEEEEGKDEDEEHEEEEKEEEGGQGNSSKQPVYNIFKNVGTVVEEQHDEGFKEDIHEEPQPEEAQNNQKEETKEHNETEGKIPVPITAIPTEKSPAPEIEQPEGGESIQPKESTPPEPPKEIPAETQEASSTKEQPESPPDESKQEEKGAKADADSPQPEVTIPPKEKPSVAFVTVTVHVGGESSPEPTPTEESTIATTESTESPTAEETAVEATPSVPGLTFTPDSEYCDPKQPDSSCYVECDVEDPYCCHPTDKDFPDCCDPDDEECWRHQFILDKPDETTPATTENTPDQTTEPPPQAQETPVKDLEHAPKESSPEPEPEKQEVGPQPAKRDQVLPQPSISNFNGENSSSSLTSGRLARSRFLRFLH